MPSESSTGNVRLVEQKTPGQWLGDAIACCPSDCASMTLVAMALQAGIVPELPANVKYA